MKIFTYVILFFAFISAVQAESIVVIANKSNSVSAISTEQSKNIFLGMTKVFENGIGIKLCERPANSDESIKFHSAITKKSASDLQNHWARLVFTGTSKQPEKCANDSDAISFVKADAGALAYVKESAVTADVKVILKDIKD